MDWQQLSVDELLRACVELRSDDAWREFVRRYHTVVRRAASRVSERWGISNREEIDDAVQEIYVKFCAHGGRVLSDVTLEHPDEIYSYIKVVAANAAHDFFRRKNADKRGAAHTAWLEDFVEQFEVPSNLEHTVALEQLHRLMLANTDGENSTRDRAIFQFYYRDGMTSAAISKLPGVNLSQKGVEGVLHRITQSLKRAVSDSEEVRT
jgi:RNA polymerase sigma factor (sigma-70 family)